MKTILNLTLLLPTLLLGLLLCAPGAKAGEKPDTMYVVKKFNQGQSNGSVQNDVNLPFVAYAVSAVDSVVYDNPCAYNAYSSCPDANHPHAIQLTDSFVVACCNVGAKNPWEYGEYFAWGETTPQRFNLYSTGSYQWCDSTSNNAASCSYTDIGTDIQCTQYDVAYMSWNAQKGGQLKSGAKCWAMPTMQQWCDLLDSCGVWDKTKSSNASTSWKNKDENFKTSYGPLKLTGMLVKGTGSHSSNFIFLPAAGDRGNGGLYGAGWYGGYWSSPAYSATSAHARDLYFYSGYVNPQANWYRYVGRSVRPFRVSAPSSGR